MPKCQKMSLSTRTSQRTTESDAIGARMSRTNAVDGRSSGCSHADYRPGKWREALATRRIGSGNWPRAITPKVPTACATERGSRRIGKYRCSQGLPLDSSPLRLTHGFSIKLLAFNLWVHPGDSMQVGKRNPLGTVTFTGIDFAAHRQTRVGALL